MNLALQLKRGISAEIFKFKRTLAFWLLIIAPAFIPVINFLILWRKGSEIIEPGQNPWDVLIGFSVDPGNFLFPFFIMILALQVNNIEYSANTWKLIYTQPLSRFSVFFSKMSVFLLMLLASLMLFATFSILVGFLLSVVSPDLGFDKPYNFSYVYSIHFKTFLTTMGMASIQFFISQRWKNLILPLGVGIAGFISIMILMQGWKYAKYHPYGYHIFGNAGVRGDDFQLWGAMNPVYYSLGLAVVVFILAGIEQTRKRII